MKLSIIVPMYNVEKYIDQCINSLLDQNIPKEEYEIILIDDGSTDKTYSLAKKYSDENTNIELISQKNLGVSTARNAGLNFACGKYIYFVDSDDYILPNSLNQLINISDDFKLDILEFKMIRTRSRILKIQNNGNISLKDLKILDGKKYISTRSYHDSNCVYFYNREFTLKSNIKFIDGRSKQDLMFNVEIIPLASKITYFPLDVYRYVINPNSLWTSTEPTAARKSIDDFIFMTIRYSEVILKLENQKVNTHILKFKQQTMLFNIFKRILRSDLKISEIYQIIKIFISHNLYPLDNYYGKNFYRRNLILIFNNKNIFIITIWLYRIFQFPIEEIIIKNYQNKNM